MTWAIRLPVPVDGDQPLTPAAVAELPRYLDGEDAQVCREFLVAVRSHAPDFPWTVGMVADALAECSPEVRRVGLDRFRRAAGLPTTAEVEAEERYEAANDAARRVAAANDPWQLCHADGCTQQPINNLGVPVPSTVRRWHCPEHKHLATEDDNRPAGPRWQLVHGRIVDVDEEEAEAARQRTLATRLATERAAEAAERAVDAAAVRGHERALADRDLTEAGHACVSALLNVPVLYVDLTGDRSCAGAVRADHQITDRDSAVTRMKTVERSPRALTVQAAMFCSAPCASSQV